MLSTVDYAQIHQKTRSFRRRSPEIDDAWDHLLFAVVHRARHDLKSSNPLIAADAVQFLAWLHAEVTGEKPTHINTI